MAEDIYWRRPRYSESHDYRLPISELICPSSHLSKILECQCCYVCCAGGLSGITIETKVGIVVLVDIPNCPCVGTLGIADAGRTNDPRVGDGEVRNSGGKTNAPSVGFSEGLRPIAPSVGAGEGLGSGITIEPRVGALVLVNGAEGN